MRCVGTPCPGTAAYQRPSCASASEIAGEQDITENIIHLALARIDGCVPGTKGISLFVVPKYWPTEAGEKMVAIVKGL